MTFEQLLRFYTDPKIRRIREDDSLTDFQKAANIHAIMAVEEEPVKPAKARQPRQPKAKAEPLMLTSGDDHAS